ncbi:MAG: SUMF1/EgtB/PvdO family nonheme iron enzyme [Treponema sp.]|nr:SUMF1/EgtB/PvdO family nonheme iron enzyme [Treponema sp.]
MKSILKKVAGIAIAVALVFGMFSCSDGSNDDSASPTSSIKMETVATPAFSVSAGEIASGTKVIISCTTEGAKIYYTTDGSKPTASSTQYTAGINITAAVAIKAIAVKDGMNDSAVASASYTIKVSAAVSDFVLIPAGKFQMGNDQGYDSSKPVHTVTISKGFYMCDHEVTQAEYQTVMGSNPSYFVGEQSHKKVVDGEVQGNRPVENVNWYMAIVYCNKRSIKEGLTPCYRINEKTNPDEWGTIPTSNDKNWHDVECNWNANGYRLPTEAEWEYAARAGDTTVDSYTWSGTNTESRLENYAWYESNSGSKTHEVKKKRENANRLYDMSGNVLEWCWDWWPEKGCYSEAAATDPRGDDSSGFSRVVRGGSCVSVSGNCSVNCRFSAIPLEQYNDLGFRVCRNAD